MMILSLLTGFGRAFQYKRMIIAFYLINLFAGLLVMFPLRGMIDDFAGNSLVGKNLAGGMNIDFLLEFLFNNPGGIRMLGGLILIAACLYWMTGLFLSGGAFVLLKEHAGWNSGLFWSSSAKYFGRFFRLWLLSIPLLIAFYLVQYIESGVVRLIYGADLYDSVKFWSGVFRLAISYTGIVLYYVVLDYARIIVVQSDEHSMTKALRASMKFTFSHIISTLGLALSLFVAGMLILVLYKVIGGYFSDPSAMIVILLILFQQIVILTKTGLKIVLYAGQVSLYEKLMPPAPVLEIIEHEVRETPEFPDSASQLATDM